MEKTSYVSMLAVAMFFAAAVSVFATASITTSPNVDVSADTAAVAGGTGAYTAVGNIVLTEGATDDVGTGTIILNAPAGFVFSTTNTVTATVAKVSGSSGTSALTLTNSTAVVTTNTIAIRVSAGDNGAARSSITWSGIRVRPTAGTPLASGEITKAAGGATIVGIAAGTNSFATLTEVGGASATLSMSVQPSSTALAGTNYTTQPVVLAVDQFANNVVDGTVITARQTSGGNLNGTTTARTATTASGLATFSGLFSTNVGTITLTFTNNNKSVVSSSIVVSAGAANALTVTQQPSGTATAGTAFAQQPKVTVRDTYGNLVVDGTVVTATQTSGGTLNATTTAQTASTVSGVATFSGLFITNSGSSTLTFTANGKTATSSSITVSAAPASKLAFNVQPSSTTRLTTISPSVTVRVQDAFGNTVSSNAAIIIAIGTNAGSGVLSGNTNITASAGTSTFTNLQINSVGTGYTLTATAAGLTSATSASFDITGLNRYAVANGNWNATSTWAASSAGPAGASVPTNGDNVFIGESASSRTVTITSGYNAQCGALSMGTMTDNTSGALVFSAASSTLTVNGNVVMNRPNAGANSSIGLNAGTMTVNGDFEMAHHTAAANNNNRINTVTNSTGTLTITGDLIFGGEVLEQNQIIFTGAGTLNLGGAFTLSNGHGVLTPSTGTVNFNGSSAQTIPVGVSSVTYNNLQVNGTGNATLSTNITSARVAGNLTVSGGTLDNGGFNITLASAKNFLVTNSATFKLTGTSSNAVVSGGGTKSFATTSTVNFAGANQPVSADSYGNLALSGTGVKTVPAGTVVRNNFALTGVSASLAAAANIGVNSLTLGGVNKASGTWGSSSSTATHQNNTYFAATTGIVTVSNGVASSTAVSSSVNPATPLDSITFTATVTGAGGTPTGSVQFKTNGVNFGSAIVLSGGSATSGSTSFANNTTTTVTAVYSGDDTYDGSTGTLAGGQVVNGLLNQTITFGTLGDKTYGDASFGVTSTANSGLTVSFSVQSGPATISDGTNVSLTGAGSVTIRASQAGNATYNPAPSVDRTFTVAAKSVTPSVAVANKVYDAGTSASITNRNLTGVINSDDVSLTGGAASFADKVVGGGKTVTVTNLSLAGTKAGNYVLSSTSASTTADITARALAVTASALDKIYDATAAASITLTNAAILGDDVVVTNTDATFSDANVGTNKTVTVNGVSASGADLGNYTYSTNVTTTASITALGLTPSVAVDNKVYDGGTTATITNYSLPGVLNSEDVTVTGGTASFATKTVGVGKPVVTTGLTLAGAGSGNYVLTTTTVTNTAEITARTLTITATGADKVYNASTAASVNFSDDRVSGDDLSITGSASFGDKHVGTNKTVSVTGISVTGGDAGNYSYNSTASATASITARALTITASASNKAYDATNTASITLTNDAIGGDDLTVNYTSATFSDANIGTNKTVTVNGASVTGADAGDYSYSLSISTTANITAVGVTAVVTASDKTYDGNDTATLATRSLTGAVSGDDVSLTGGTATFADKNAGTNKTVTATGLSLSGTSAGNYTLVSSSATTTASITSRSLTITALNDSKTYNGLGYSGGNGVRYVGFATGETNTDLVGSLSYGGTSQGATNAGSYSIVPSGYSSYNYTFIYANGSLTVNPAKLTVSADNETRAYGVANPTFTASYSGFVNGEGYEVLTGFPVLTTSANETSPAGTYSIDVDLSFLSADNYTLVASNGVLTVTAAPGPEVLVETGKLLDGNVSLTFAGTPGLTYVVQATEALTPPNWVNISTNVAGVSGTFQFNDLTATNHQYRYYRTERQ